MEKRLGSSAGVLALLAVLIHTFANSGVERKDGSAAATKAAIAGSPASGSHKPHALSVENQGPWRASQQYFHATPGGSAGDQQSCLIEPTDKCSRSVLLASYGFPKDFNEQNIQALIATVPDPLHSRLAMETDRYLDAIQQAAFRSGWELATQWLPWTFKAEAALKSDSTDSAQGPFDVEKLPGLLIFRPHFEPEKNKIDHLLLIFVVGETPTAGINGFQFRVAQQTLNRLGSNSSHKVFIAGPNFSGSFLSLTRLLEESTERLHFELHAGSVSNSDYARAMLLELQSKGFAVDSQAESENQRSVSFHSSTIPSASFHHHFVRLVKTFGLKPEQAAELVEDETGFSFTDNKLHVDAEQFPIAIYRYPRDIAQLRNVYNDAAFISPSVTTETKAAPDVEFSLKDAQSGEDNFPMFSSSHTPISQNAELQQMVAFLNRRSIRLVSLSATNVFDTLFLANVLARNCPDTRIVLRGPDLLFVQEAAQGSLSGLMSISPFPLFPEGAEWSRSPNSAAAKGAADVVTFATADQIGEFDAVMSLLRLQQGSKTPDRQPFEAAFEAKALFSAWVLVLGPSGWLPVDLYGQSEVSLPVVNQKGAWFDPGAIPGRQIKLQASLPKARQGWKALCLAAVVFSFAFCGWLFYLRFDSRRLVWSVLCLSDLDTPERGRAVSEIVHSRYLCMMSCFASLALLNALLLCPMLAAHFIYGGCISPVLEGLAALAYVACIGTATYLSLVVPVRVCHEGPLRTCPIDTPVSVWSLVLRASILALSLGGAFLWWRCCDNGVTGYMLCFRTLTMAAPICPLWPLFLATCGLFSLAYFHLRRFTWGDRRQPHLETSLFDEALCNEFSTLKARLEQNLLRPFSVKAVPGLPLLTLSALLIILVLWILFPEESLRSFEPHGFSMLLSALLLPLGVFALLTFVRFIRSWRVLRAFLVSLNSVVLGRFFMRVPEFGGSGPVWIREVKLMSLASAVNSAIALHNLEKASPAYGYTEEYTAKLRNLLSPGKGHGTRLQFIYAYAEFRLTAGLITQSVGERVLLPYWRKNKLPFVGTSPADSGDPADTSAPQKADPVVQLASAVAAGNGSPVQVRSLNTAVGEHSSVALSTTATLVPVEDKPKPVEQTATISTEAYEYAAKYVAMQYSIYVGYVLHQLQNLLYCSIACFVFLVAALNSFSFQAPQAMFRFLMVTLVVSAVAVLSVLAQIERDPILSRLSGTPEGELGKDFYLRALSYGALPVLTVVTTQFPSISRFVSAWVQSASAAVP